MNPSRSFISVIIPVHNGLAFLEEAIATLRAQTRPPDEVIVVDDGSTDGSAERAAVLAPSSRILRQENCGPSAARNRGLSEARGDVIAFLDVDDLWPPGKLALQLTALEEDPEVDVVQGFVKILPGEGERLPAKLLAPHFRVNLGAGLYRRRVFDEVGTFDVSMRYGEDLDWLLRTREAGKKVRWIREVTLLYRRHPDAMTHGRERTELGVFEAVKQSLDRRRAQGSGPIAPLTIIDEKPSPPTLGRQRVSVIIPAFNAERFIASALASVKSQTRPPDEIIVIDDGSDDATAEVVAGLPGVSLVRQEHRGVAAARNRGLEVATGNIIAWLDADDLWHPEALATQLAALDRAGGEVLVLGSMREFREAGHSEFGRLEKEAGPAAVGEFPGVSVAHRGVYERVGPLSTSFRVGEFMDWCLRARESGEPIVRHDEVVLFRRLHDDNLGLRERDDRRDYLQLVRAKLARQRRAEGRHSDG